MFQSNGKNINKMFQSNGKNINLPFAPLPLRFWQNSYFFYLHEMDERRAGKT